MPNVIERAGRHIRSAALNFLLWFMLQAGAYLGYVLNITKYSTTNFNDSLNSLHLDLVCFILCSILAIIFLLAGIAQLYNAGEAFESFKVKKESFERLEEVVI